jgi:hypothetical protein
MDREIQRKKLLTWVHQVNSGIECGRGGDATGGKGKGGGGGCGENARSGRGNAGGGGENAAEGGGENAGGGSGGVGGGGETIGGRGGGDTEVAEGHKLAAGVKDAEEFVEPVGQAEAHLRQRARRWLLKYEVITQDQQNYENNGHTPKLLFRVVELKDMWKVCRGGDADDKFIDAEPLLFPKPCS